MKCSRNSPAKAAKAAMKCKAAKAMKIGRPRKCSKVKKAMKVAECSKVKKAMKVAECSKVKKAMKAMEDWKVAMKAAKVAMKAECSKLKKAMKAVECLKETKWKLAKAANEGQELGMWLDLWLDEIRTLGTTLLTSASKERYATLLWLDEIETRGATTEDWWKRDLPEWVFEEAMATAQKNNLDEGIVQPSGVLPGHVKLCDDKSVEKGCYVIKDPQASGRDAADNCHNCARAEALCRCCRCGYAMCERCAEESPGCKCPIHSRDYQPIPKPYRSPQHGAEANPTQSSFGILG